MGDSEERKGGRRWIWVVVVVVFVWLLYVLVPAFIKYTHVSRQAPCHEIWRINSGARQYYVVDHWDSHGNLLPKAFPDRMLMTPPKGPSCERQITPSAVWDAAGWGPLHFALIHGNYCAYEFWGSGLTGTAQPPSPPAPTGTLTVTVCGPPPNYGAPSITRASSGSWGLY